MTKPKMTDDLKTVRFSFGAKFQANTHNATVKSKTTTTV